MAILRNRRKLAAVSTETPEGSRSSRGQNVLDPELTQDYYISQVSEEIEGRVTKKLSKELSKTESRILGDLWKLDEFLLNPQVRTCSVAVQGTSRNVNSESRETNGDHSSNDPYPEVGFFPHHSGQLNSAETETNSHMVTEKYPHRKYSLLFSSCSFFFLKTLRVAKSLVARSVHTCGVSPQKDSQLLLVSNPSAPTFLICFQTFLTNVPFFKSRTSLIYSKTKNF